MKTNKKTLIYGTVVVATIVTSWLTLYVSCLPDSVKKPRAVLDPGWQFYSKPTTLEPPGSVFRIDRNGRRFLVDSLDATIDTGTEVVGKTEQIVEVSTNILAKLFGGYRGVEIDSKGHKTERFQFEMVDTERETITDKAIDDILPKFAKRVVYRKESRYFIIREARSATKLHYVLTEGLFNAVGGEASLRESMGGSGNLSIKKGKRYVLSQTFPERMRIMFLPEEIVMTGSSLSGGIPEFGTVAVEEELTWED